MFYYLCKYDIFIEGETSALLKSVRHYFQDKEITKDIGFLTKEGKEIGL